MESTPMPEPIQSLHDETLRTIFERHYTPEGGRHNRRDPIYLQALTLASGDEEKGIMMYQEFRRTIDALAAIDWRQPDSDEARAMMDTVVGFVAERIGGYINPDNPGNAGSS